MEAAVVPEQCGQARATSLSDAGADGTLGKRAHFKGPIGRA